MHRYRYTYLGSRYTCTGRGVVVLLVYTSILLQAQATGILYIP